VKFKSQPWAGVYWLAGGWGERRGVNLRTLLGAVPKDRIAVEFFARGKKGGEVVAFKVGGVTAGKFPDSIEFPLSTGNITLSQDWRRYTIELGDEDLSNVQGGFCWAVAKDQQPREHQERVDFYLDDIRVAIVPSFEKKLSTLRWICYAPTGWDPKKGVFPSEESIREDLKVLRPYFNGVILYSSKSRWEDIPRIAHEEDMLGCIGGVWSPTDDDEIAAAKRLCAERMVDALCVGNEGLDGKYKWNQLEAALESLRSKGLPITTSEQIDDYGDSRFDRFDWFFPIAHPIWNGVEDPNAAAEWTLQRATALRKRYQTKPILFKETGFPTAGGESYSPEAQSQFFQAILQRSESIPVPFAFFEAFDQEAKRETTKPGDASQDVGPHWGLFSSTRKPKSVIDSIITKLPK
jgi:exo-beta-1,3-glucanase (GH17 family)